MSDLLAAARLGNYPTCEKLLISAKVKKSGIKFPRYVLSIINSADNLGCFMTRAFHVLIKTTNVSMLMVPNVKYNSADV